MFCLPRKLYSSSHFISENQTIIQMQIRKNAHTFEYIDKQISGKTQDNKIWNSTQPEILKFSFGAFK